STARAVATLQAPASRMQKRRRHCCLHVQHGSGTTLQTGPPPPKVFHVRRDAPAAPHSKYRANHFSRSLRSLLQLPTPAGPRLLLPVHLFLLTPPRDCPSDRRPVASPQCASPIRRLSSFRHEEPALDRR